MKKKDIFIGRQPAIEILTSEQTVDKIMIQKGASSPDIFFVIGSKAS
jgi:hypothetical protein